MQKLTLKIFVYDEKNGWNKFVFYKEFSKTYHKKKKTCKCYNFQDLVISNGTSTITLLIFW